MAKHRKPRKNRYDVSGNAEAEYADNEQLVLKNKLGITRLDLLSAEEEAALVRGYERLLRQVRVHTPLDRRLIRQIHEVVFGDLYEWAGRWRTVWISKPGTTWPPPDFLEECMITFERTVLSKYNQLSLSDTDDFVLAASEIQGEFLVIHPFGEGNARTIKLLTDLLAIRSGRNALKYDPSAREVDAYIAAAKAAFRRDYSLLATIIRDAIARSQKSP